MKTSPPSSSPCIIYCIKNDSCNTTTMDRKQILMSENRILSMSCGRRRRRSKSSRECATWLSFENRKILCSSSNDDEEGKGEWKEWIYSNVFSSIEIIQISCGYEHTIFLSNKGQLYSTGDNAYGQLGQNDYIEREIPTLIPAFLPSKKEVEEDRIVSIACGRHHTLTLSITGSVYSFGRNDYGQLGRQLQQQQQCCCTPESIEFDNDDDNNTIIMVMIAASNEGHGSYAVSLSGHGYRWGRLSCDDEDTECSFPISFPPPLGKDDSCAHHDDNEDIIAVAASTPLLDKDCIIALSAGSSHVVLITRAGEAWVMGKPGPYLGLGPGNALRDWMYIPSRMLLKGDVLINGVACGAKFCLLSTYSGRILICGGSSKDDNDGKDSSVPRYIDLDNEFVWKDAACMTVASYSYGMEAVYKYIEQQQQRKKDDVSSYQDHDDYWTGEGDEEEDLAYYDLEMEFSLLEPSISTPFGTPPTFTSAADGNKTRGIVTPREHSWKKRLSNETKKTIQAVGGAISSVVSSSVVAGVVSKVATAATTTMATTPTTVSHRKISDASSKKTFGSSNSGDDSHHRHRDSFDGLAGKARRQIMLAAGADCACVHILNHLDDK